MSKSTRYAISAAYVKDALLGNYHLAGFGYNFHSTKKFPKRCLELQSHLIYDALIILIATSHCLLTTWEPAQMSTSSNPIHNSWALGMGILFVVLYSCDIVMTLLYTDKSVYIYPTHNKIYCAAVVLIGIDYIIYLASCRMFFRFLRSCILLVRVAPIRDTALVMLGVIPKVVQFFLVLAIYIAVFAAIGMNLFFDYYAKPDHRSDKHNRLHYEAFSDIGRSMLTVFVLMTGGSYPRVMMPAYKETRGVSIPYFVLIIFTGEIVLYAILVARIYDFYVEANKKSVKRERYLERQCLAKAFSYLDRDRAGFASYSSWEKVLTIILPKATSSEIRKRFFKMKYLASNKTSENIGHGLNRFTLVEFFLLPSVLQFTIEKSVSRNGGCFEKSCILMTMHRISRSYYDTDVLRNMGIACYAIYSSMLALTWWNISSVTVVARQYGFAIGLTTDMKWHISIVATSVVLAIISWSVLKPLPLKQWTYIFSHLALLLRFAIFGSSSSLFHWIRRMTPPLCTLFGITFIALYSYAVLGMEFFGHLGNQKEAEPMEYGISICRYGFGSIGCSILTLFQVSLGSSWYKVMDYIMHRVNSWASLYFVFFYALMQMVVLNVVSATVVELSNAVSLDETEAKKNRRILTDNQNRPHPNTEHPKSSLGLGPMSSIKNHSGDEVTLSERKGVGKWNRDIAPDLTFLSADEMKTFQRQMLLNREKFINSTTPIQ